MLPVEVLVDEGAKVLDGSLGDIHTLRSIDGVCHSLDTLSKLSLGRRHGTADLYMICLAICFSRLVIH